MTYVVKLTSVNEVRMRVSADPGILEEIADKFTFLVDGYQHMPSFKAGFWDGKIRLFSPIKSLIYKGLLVELSEFCQEQGYKISMPSGGILPSRMREMHTVREELKTWASESTSDEYDDRNYQMEAFANLVAMERAVALSSTSSGKTLMIYRLLRYFAELTGKPALMVTSRTNLVVQSQKDFANYDHDGNFKVAIMKGDSKVSTVKDIDCVVSTWQSATKKDAEWFSQFSIVIADEAHGWDSKSCTSIMEKCTHIKYRYAFTGTLDGTKMNKMILTGLFGPVTVLSTTKQRIDAGDTSNLAITCIKLDYHESDRKKLKKFHYDPINNRWKPATYQEEVSFVITHEHRRKFILNLASSLSGNTLILFTRNDDFGKPLFEMFKEAGRNCKLVYGSTEDNDRELVRETLEKENGIDVIASLGTFSEGMSVNNLHNIILAYPVKGQVRLLQSIGRGLRKSDGKEVCNFYDIVDDIRSNKTDNHLWNHALIRCQIYDSQQFNYVWKTIKLKPSNY